jgi:site-specific recombinase XerD
MKAKRVHLISREIDSFIVDRKARKRSNRTIEYYEDELKFFAASLERQSVTTLEAIEANHLRFFLVEIGEHRNKGGVHATYRAMKAFLFWWADEIEDDHYRRLFKKIGPPTVSKVPLPGIPLEHVTLLLQTCDRKTDVGQRDYSIIVTLVDTGVRRGELVALNYQDINMKTGAVQIYNGKGDKDRVVYLGARARRELIRYLRSRPAMSPASPLYATMDNGTRISPDGLRGIICRRALAAHIPEPGLHDFRRTYAIESLRNGIDIVTLMHLMGHTTTTVLQRYLKLIEADLQRGHDKSSPADNW